MGDDMQKKIAIVSIIVALIIVISVSIGTTYSLWTTSVHQESTNTIDVGCFNISFSDENILDWTDYTGVNITGTRLNENPSTMINKEGAIDNSTITNIR